MLVIVKSEFIKIKRKKLSIKMLESHELRKNWCNYGFFYFWIICTTKKNIDYFKCFNPICIVFEILKDFNISNFYISSY